MRAQTAIAGAALVALTLSPRSARANEPPPSPAPSAAPSVAVPSSAPAPPPSPKRPLPDYNGLGRRPTTPGEVVLWIPRILLSPLYLTTEWVIRRPLGAAASAAERADLPTILYNFFAFGPDHKAGIVPIAFVDFGFNPSVGVYGFWDDAFFKGDDLRVHVSFWTDDWIGASLAQRIRFHKKDSVQLKLLGVRRPDHVFYGIGPSTLESAQSRYAEDKLDFGVLFNFSMWRSSKIDAGAGVRSASFRDGHYGRDPGILQEAAAGVFPLPTGFANGYTAEYNDVLVALDSRRPYPADGSGVRIEAQAEQGSDVRQSPASGWIHTAGGAGAFWDVNGSRRVVSLSMLTMFSDPLGSRPVPFTELVTVGGDIASPGAFPAPMPGFFPGRLVDRSAAVATLRYKWPIGPWIDGSLQGAVGNVFGEHLEGFETRLLRFSGAFGIESDSSPDSSFEFIVGFGTETFDHGGQIDSLRLALGITRF
ncbi:MAG: hypothetical protein ABSF69_09660 [Polyangiaceae bacterium]|jgi:hypothetical protein